MIVTAGVLMGIQVSNWNDSRIEKARLGEQLASLRIELQSNLGTIERHQRQIDSQLADIAALERMFDRLGDGHEGVDGKLMRVFRVSSLILETSAYDEINPVVFAMCTPTSARR